MRERSERESENNREKKSERKKEREEERDRGEGQETKRESTKRESLRVCECAYGTHRQYATCYMYASLCLSYMCVLTIFAAPIFSHAQTHTHTHTHQRNIKITDRRTNLEKDSVRI